MNEKKLITLFLVATLIVLFGGIFLVSNTSGTSSVVASKNAKAVVDAESFDWGVIPMNKGKVSKKFLINNAGADVLKLMNIKTSCHCTVAYVTIDGKESPNFGMSGVSSWVGEVKPNTQALLTVVFDPAFHGPNGVGPIRRYISVETNDVSNSKITFTVTGTVVKD